MCAHTHTFTRARTRTHKHLVTVNRCQGHCGGSQVFSSVPYQKQYIVHTLLTQNAEVRIYKLHMHTHARAHTRTHTHIHKHKTSETTKDLILSLSLSLYDFLPSGEKNKCVSPNPPFLEEWFSVKPQGHALFFVFCLFFFCSLSLLIR